MKVMLCTHCKNQTYVLNDSGVPMVCCGENMNELSANTTDAATEKHVPYVVLDGNTLHVTVGEVPHPMQEEHFINWIAVEQNRKAQFVILHPTNEPKADFVINPDKPYTVYEYCNLHGLWKV